MKTINVAINEAGSELSALVEQAESGVRVCLTSFGKPKAFIVPASQPATPWRVEVPDDPDRYGDLQSPVMEAWP